MEKEGNEEIEILKNGKEDNRGKGEQEKKKQG